MVLLTVAATANYIPPAAWRGKIVTVRAEGLDIYFALGGNSVAVDDTATCSVASNAITYVANCCWVIPAGTEMTIHVPIDATVTRFAMKSSGTSGKLRAYMSTGRASSCSRGRRAVLLLPSLPALPAGGPP